MTPTAETAPPQLHRVTAAVQEWRKYGRFATMGILAVLIGLPGFALWGATTTYQTGLAVRHATDISNRFERARYAVGEQESLERKYRLEPGGDVRARHRAAAGEMVAALQQAAALADRAEREHIAYMVIRHDQYLEITGRMFAAVDAGDMAAVTKIDETEADPVFNEVEAWVDQAATRHRVVAAHELKSLNVIQTKVLVATPIVFTIGVILVLLFWRMIRSFQHEVVASHAREAAGTRVSERRFRGLVQNTHDMILICAPPGTVTYQSPAAESAWGYPAGELVGKPVFGMAHPDDRPVLLDFWQHLQKVAGEGLEGSRRTVELRLRDGHGAWRVIELIGTNLLNDFSVQGIVVTVRDITERKTFERQLTEQAFYDALTGLPNRVLFRDRLEQAMVRAGRLKDAVGLLFLDLDNFKLVNDSLGHQVGDELLTEAAFRLRSCVRAQDTVARLGGDEFVVILELLTNADDALPVVKAIEHQFSRPFILSGREIVVTASIGVATSEGGQEHAESLLRDADTAMYRAKSEGRARYTIFDSSMHKDAMRRLELESGLRHAIEYGELRVFYQPIVMLNSGRLVEVEALVRWQHPTRGLVPPIEFISIAEETGLIIPLGMWVLEEACRQVVAWHDQRPAKPPLALSVNLSPRQFQQASLVTDVARVLKQTGLHPSRLKLEITESVIMRDTEAAIRTMWELKGLGLQLAIDDFGTGYSSLSYLKRLPLDVLKIDRSFVSGIGSSQEDIAIIHAIMGLARSLNLKVTGEGIETHGQAEMLQDCQCDRGQGYLFSRPLSSSDAEKFLEAEANSQTIAAAVPALSAV